MPSRHSGKRSRSARCEVTPVRELTELAGHQPQLRELVRAAFEARLGPVPLDLDFHRGWNGGWRCRATVVDKPPLDFALLRTPNDALLALPVPFPRGWRARGVLDSAGTAWTVTDDDTPVPIESTANA